MILTYILNELSYDRYNKNAENIYRVERTFMNAETKTLSLDLGSVAPPFAPLLQNDFKEIKKITRFLEGGTTAFRYNDKIFNEQHMYFADENLFNVFNVNVTRGNPSKALSDPYSIMLTEDVAKKYFGKEDPINKLSV
ncbi:MAG: ABC transporter permease [Segetibacter sp.]